MVNNFLIIFEVLNKIVWILIETVENFGDSLKVEFIFDFNEDTKKDRKLFGDVDGKLVFKKADHFRLVVTEKTVKEEGLKIVDCFGDSLL